VSRPTALRRLKHAAYRAMLGAVPFGLRVAATRRLFPQLRRYLPGGREIEVDGYLGRFRVTLDMTYPIEREMLVDWYEPDAIAVIDALVREGDTCLDVGANVGALTLAMAKRVGPTGKVFAFEPGPLTYRRLARNVALNPSISSRVVPVRLGVGDRPGTLYWNEQADNRGNATLLEPAGTPVQVVTVDDYFATEPLKRLRFVKIDVEGMEYEVLLGGRATWLAHRPAIYLETFRHYEAARGAPIVERLETLLRDLGYRLFRITDDRRLESVSAATAAMYTLAVPTTDSELVDGARLPGASPRPRRPTPVLFGRAEAL
jgi:FkbM family methyltransferase